MTLLHFQIPSPIFSDIPIELFETIHILKEELTSLARDQEVQIENVRKVRIYYLVLTDCPDES